MGLLIKVTIFVDVLQIIIWNSISSISNILFYDLWDESYKAIRDLNHVEYCLKFLKNLSSIHEYYESLEKKIS